VADTGAIWRGPVGTKNIESVEFTERRVQGTSDQMRDERPDLPGAALRIRARNIEVTHGNIFQSVSSTSIGEHDLSHQFRPAIRINRIGHNIFGNGDSIRIAIDRGSR